MFRGSQGLLKGSLLFNLLLMGALGYGVHRLRQSSNEGNVAESRGAVEAMKPLLPSDNQKAALPVEDSKEKPAPGFTWRQIESPDYRVYITNLQSIGCPDETICDIITADVNKLYAGRKAALRTAIARPFKYWQTTEHSRPTVAQQVELQRQDAALEEERKSVLRELLGQVCGGPATDGLAAEKLAVLSPQEQIQVAAILQKYPGVEDQTHTIVDSGSISNQTGEMKQLLQQYEQKRAELEQLLGPEKLEQYYLNTSWTSDNVRNRLTGFNPTEAEFKAIFDVWHAQDDRLVGVYINGEPDPGTREVNDAVKAVLGEDRYQEYVRSWDGPDYRQMAQLASDYSLPQETPAQLDAMKQAALAQQSQLQGDASLNDDQRAAALQTLREQTAQKISQQLGSAAYEVYIQSSGNWLNGIAPPAGGKQ